MPQGEEASDNTSKSWRFFPRTRRSRIALAVLVGAVFGAILAWTQRETIADNIINDQLAALGIDASYEIVSIGPRRQLIRKVIIGDAVRPDLRIDEVEVRIAYGFGAPSIDALRLTRPQANAVYDEEDGLSFGALDKIIFAESDEPAELPDIDLEVIGGNIVIFTRQEPIKLSFEGAGGLADGFAGKITGGSSRVAIGPCEIAASKFDGTIRVVDRQPKFEGPYAAQSINCVDTGVRVAPLNLKIALTADRDLAGYSSNISLGTGKLTQGDFTLSSANGLLGLEQRDGILVAKYDLKGIGLAASQFSVQHIGLQGEVRTQGEDGRLEIRGKVAGEELRPDASLLNSIKSAGDASSGYFAQPLLAKFHSALGRESRDSSFNADFLVRQSEHSQAFVVPQAAWRSKAGKNLLSLSQVQFAVESGQVLRVSGNLVTGGKDLPLIVGRMEQAPSGNTVLRLRMDPYASGEASVAGPDIAIAQNDNGSFGLSGQLLVSGDIPGGSVRQLAIPLQGGWNGNGDGWLWRNCTKARFKQLELTSLTFENQQLEFCPKGRRSVAALTKGGGRLEMLIPQQAWKAKFGDEEAQVELAAAEISSVDGFSASQLKFVSGEGDEVTHFAFESLGGKFDKEIQGTFSGGEFGLGPVPFEFTQAVGDWKFADGVLSMGESSLLMDDRVKPKRFNTVLARNFLLTLEDGVVRTEGTLRNAETGRDVADISIRHELASGDGYADLSVPGLVFDDRLQPEHLSDFALGIVALADGTLTGEGRIDWKGGEITSTGELRTDKFDFAAEFGPVEGVSGIVRFTDLISLTTEPDQRLQIASMNPGIEVLDGEMLIEMREGQIIAIKGGIWPFLGGTLTLRPVELNIGIPEERRYIIEIEGADAAQFIATMEMTNLSASGTFDGTLPIVFDEFGNGRIDNGLLVSRPPGGNLSYVGELTYEDLSAIGNFAFGSLRSLDYKQMKVEMNGPLIGEIVTRLQFDGIRQGEKASRNFITKQIAKLPIQFRVNIRAPFYQLLTSFESMYDASFLRDPRDLGLLYSDGKRFLRPDEGKADTSDEPPIQRQESELVP